MIKSFGSSQASVQLLKQFLMLGIEKTKTQSAYSTKGVSMPKPDTPMMDKAREGQTLTSAEQAEMRAEMKRLHTYRVLSVDA